MIELDNRTTLEVDEPLLNKIANTLTDKEIELIITNNAEIMEINSTHRGINSPTDVLSFPYDDMPMTPLGSIVISKEFTQNKADELGHTYLDEMSLLFIHGLLHLLGYDHEVDNGEMRKKEEEMITLFHLPESLIVRTEG
jgi:probable rRNA maturation factor